jgi:hypothetical protein
MKFLYEPMNVPKKHRELADDLLDSVKAQFPSIHFLSMNTSPESENDIWIHVSVPDEDTFMAVCDVASVIEADALISTGYKLTLMPHLTEAMPV